MEASGERPPTFSRRTGETSGRLIGPGFARKSRCAQGADVVVSKHGIRRKHGRKGPEPPAPSSNAYPASVSASPARAGRREKEAVFRACLLAALLAVAAFAASPAIAGFETGDFPIDDYPSAFPGIDRIQAKWLQGSLFDTPAFVFNEGDADHICQSLDGKLALATFVTDQTPLQMAFNFQSKMVSVVRA